MSITYIPFSKRIGPAPLNGGFAMDDYWVWCGSAIKGDDDRYHLFAARWPEAMKFLPGYQSYSEIVHAIADVPAGPYAFADVALGDRGAQHWDGRMTHNPVITRWGGRYALFYIGTTFEGPRPSAAELETGPSFYPWYRSIRIGVAYSDSASGTWERMDRPLLEPRPGMWDEHVVTNPAPCVAPNGRLFLYYRSYIKGQGCKLGLAIFEDPRDPPVWRSDRPLFEREGLTVEDPCVFHIDGHFEMIAKDLNGKLVGELHAGAHLISEDGLAWELTPERKAYSLDVRWDDGSARRVAQLERPQVFFEAGRPAWLFAAIGEGEGDIPGGFGELTRTWNAAIPLIQPR